jgi:heat-inducible transcriptional repressor
MITENMSQELTERQKEILRYVVCNYIVTTRPVASRYIARHEELGLSPASIRNTLADLEELGYITQPHLSAGRIPTDKGYRFFVDWLVELQPLSSGEKGDIRSRLGEANEADEVLHETAKILGVISHQLSIVSAPHLTMAVLAHLELISVSSNKIFVILTVRSGIVKTITMEVTSEISQERLSAISGLLNERLSGLTLEAIRDTFALRVKDFRDEKTGIIDMFIRSADKIFDDAPERERLHISGTRSLVEQPEYGDPDNVRSIIELINNEGKLASVIERNDRVVARGGISVSIGTEHGDDRLKNYSVVMSVYTVDELRGTIGVIGPKRMNYAKVIPLVNYLAEEVSSSLS